MKVQCPTAMLLTVATALLFKVAMYWMLPSDRSNAGVALDATVLTVSPDDPPHTDPDTRQIGPVPDTPFERFDAAICVPPI